MKLSKYQKRCKVLDRINTTIVILIIICSIISIWTSARASIDVFLYFFAIISLVFGLISLLVGKFLPPKSANVSISAKQASGAAAFSFLLNGKIVSPSLLKGGPLFRSWNFLFFLIISPLMALFTGLTSGILYTNQVPAGAKTSGIATILWLSLLPFCLFWTYYNSCVEELAEYGENYEDLGKKIKHQLKCGSIAFFILIGIVVAFVYIDEKANPHKNLSVDTKDLHQKLDNINKKLDDLDSQQFYPSKEFDTIEDALIDIQNSHEKKTIYYKIENISERQVYIVTWNDDSEDVYVDTYNIIEGNRLKRSTSFISSSLKKSELIGQEDGIVEGEK